MTQQEGKKLKVFLSGAIFALDKKILKTFSQKSKDNRQGRLGQWETTRSTSNKLTSTRNMRSFSIESHLLKYNHYIRWISDRN